MSKLKIVSFWEKNRAEDKNKKQRKDRELNTTRHSKQQKPPKLIVSYDIRSENEVA